MKDIYGTLNMKRRLRMTYPCEEYYNFVEISNGTFSNTPREWITL